MVITCLRSELRDIVSVIERFCGKNLNLPILSHILLEAHKSQLIIKATNLEIGATATIPVKVIKEGKVTLPPRILSSILQTISDEMVTIKEKDSIITIETETTTSDINGINPTDFPIIPSISKEKYLKIANSDLKNTLSRILPVINYSEFKPEISGIFIHSDKKDLVFTGTDSFRLAEQRLKNFSGSEKDYSLIIPVRIMQEVLRVLPQDGETEFIFNTEQVQVVIGEMKFISRLISGKYPDYQSLLPKEFSTTLRLDREGFLVGARLSGVFASKLHDVVLSYQPKHVAVEISNPEVGKHTREVTGSVEGKPGRVGFNHIYLTDALECLSAEKVIVGIQEETRPIKVYSEEDPSFFTIVMPLRI
jgi:DNA polymerase III subunit beta